MMSRMDLVRKRLRRRKRRRSRRLVKMEEVILLMKMLKWLSRELS